MDTRASKLRQQFDESGVTMPNFFIVGAPKCATTALAVSLSLHPDVFVSSPKEPHAFGEDLPALRIRSLIEPENYLSLFRGVTSESAVGEASVWYLRSTTAAREIHEFNPDARIIVMLRNPVDMLYSLHGEFLRAGVEHLADFPVALDAEIDRRQGKQIRGGVSNFGQLHYSEAVAFCSQLVRFLDEFGTEAVHVILFDDVQVREAMVMRETQQFLGIRVLNDIPLLRLNEGHTVRSPWFQHIARQQSLLRAVSRRLVTRKGRARISNLVVRGVEHVNVTRERLLALPTDLTTVLTERFRPEIEQLALLIGRDLSTWTDTTSSAQTTHKEFGTLGSA